MDELVKSALISKFEEKKNDFDVFGSGIRQWFLGHDGLRKEGVVHSVRYRLKDVEHLREKLGRKFQGQDLTHDDFFRRINDLVGIRVLHLHQAQFSVIHAAITKKVEDRDWHLAEPPKAFTWDPESRQYFEGLGLEAELRDTYYTSVHYIVRPREDSPISCEIQVRTLFEEIWGEVDHQLNYPTPTERIACREQLRVLSKLVGAGSRLVDSIFNSAA